MNPTWSVAIRDRIPCYLRGKYSVEAEVKKLKMKLQPNEKRAYIRMAISSVVSSREDEQKYIFQDGSKTKIPCLFGRTDYMFQSTML